MGVFSPTMQKYVNRGQRRNVIRANVNLRTAVKIVSGVKQGGIPDTILTDIFNGGKVHILAIYPQDRILPVSFGV